MSEDAPHYRGKGDVRDLVARREKTLHLASLERAVYGGWEIPEETAKSAPAFLAEVMNDLNMDTRTRVRAVEVLASLSRDRVDATVQLDRILRLDAGTATDRVEVIHDLGDQALDAVAQSLNQIQPSPKCLPKPKRKPKRKA